MGPPNPALWRRTAWLVALAAVPRCAHIPEVGEPGVADGYPIERVRLEGATAIDVDELVEGLANRSPSFLLFSLDRIGDGMFLNDYFRFDELQVELDRRRIRSFYERRGYFATEIDGPELRRIGKKADRLEIIWKIREGKPATIRDFVLRGAPEGLETRLREVTEIAVNEVYETEIFEVAQQRLRALLVRRGYAGAEVSGVTQIDKKASRALLIFDLEPGPLVHFDDLLVEGPVRTPTSAVMVRQTWARGDRFDPVQLEQLRGRLYGIDQYSGVRLDYSEGELLGDTTDILARVDELEQNELQLGVGGGFDNTNIYLRLRARYKRRNFPLPLTNLSLEVSPGLQFLREGDGGLFSNPEVTPQARLTLTWYDFLWPRFVLQSDVGFEYQQLEAYEWFGPDVGQTLSRAIFDDRLEAAVGWRFHQYGYVDPRVFGPDDDSPLILATEPTPQERLNITGGQSVIVLRPSLTFEGRDDPLNPRRGWFARVSMDLGLATGADSAGFLLLHPELRGYLPIGSRLVLAGRINLVSNLRGDLPAPRRLFAGGASSQRGFPQRRLSADAVLVQRDRDGNVVSPRVVDGVTVDENGRPITPADIPIGGQALLEINLEARLRIVKIFGFWFGVAAFLDAADLGDTLEDIDVANLYYAAGGGLRYITPIGAIRVDYGYRLNRTGPNDFYPCDGGPFTCGAFHLSLGQAF